MWLMLNLSVIRVFEDMSVHSRLANITLVYARHIHDLYPRRYANFDMFAPDRHSRLHN
jgi:hypothetical protein